MIETDATVSIARAIEDVFAFVSDPANDKAWQSDVIKASVAGGALAVGSRVRRLVKFMGRRDVELEVTALEAPRHLQMQGLAGAPMGLKPLITYVLAPVDGGTRFTRSLRMQPAGAARIMAPMMGMMARRYNRRFVKSLKDVLER